MDCSIDIDDCDPNPCQNGGNCTDGQGLNSYTCACPPGYSGVDCENNDVCMPNPCKNGGTCTNLLSHFNCTCNPIYSGDDCSSK